MVQEGLIYLYQPAICLLDIIRGRKEAREQGLLIHLITCLLTHLIGGFTVEFLRSSDPDALQSKPGGFDPHILWITEQHAVYQESDDNNNHEDIC